MKSHRKTTSINLAASYAMIGLSFVSGFVLPPLYIKYISAEMYGAWLATGNLLTWLSVLDPGLSVALQQRVAHAYGEKNKRAIGAYVGAGVLISAFFSVFVMGTGLVFHESLIGWLELPSSFDVSALTNAFFLAIIATGILLFSFSFYAINIAGQSALAAGIVQVGGYSLSIALIIWMVTHGFGVASIAWGLMFRAVFWLVGNAAFVFYRMYILERVWISLSAVRTKELIRLTSFTFLGRASHALTNSIDSFLVARFLGPQRVTLLEMTRRTAMSATPLIERFSNALMPSISHLDGEGRKESLRNVVGRLLRILIWGSAVFFGGFLYFNGAFVRLWLGDEFYAGFAINLLICIGLVLKILLNSFSNLCIALGDIEKNNVVRFIESVIFAAFLYIGISQWGLLGVVAAPIASKLLVSSWYYPRALGRLIGLSIGDYRSIFIELIKASLVIGLLYPFFGSFSPAGWVEFAFIAGAFGAIYLGLLFALSRPFRGEALGLSRRILAMLK